MAALMGPNDWQDRKVREWLLLLLRFAVTREPLDQAAALAMADELDSVSPRWRPAAPSFFSRTSSDVCEALLSAKKGTENAILRQHASRIDDLRLRLAFEVAAGLHAEAKPHQQGRKGRKGKGRKKTAGDLWKGLRKK
jgi:hypothetical protein